MFRLASPLVLLTLLVSGLIFGLAGCGADEEPRAGDTPAPDPGSSSSTSPSASATPSAPPKVSARPKVIGTVAENLEAPWGIAFLPDGTGLVTERDSGKVFTVGGGKVDQVGTVDQAAPNGEAGLLGVVVSPSYAENQQVFLYVSTDEDNRVLRTTLRDGKLGALKPVLTGIPLGSNHDGGRMIFGPDGMLYVSTGEAGQRDLAQDRDSLGGKILRITPEGRPAPGNPFPGSPVWSWGHRNVQGLAFDDDDNLWASEFGDSTYDELNLIEKGRNYGWPVVEGIGREPGMTNPQVTWSTDEASPSGLAFLGGRLWLGALRGEQLWRVDVNGKKASGEKGFLVGKYGRIRTVAAAPDGNLWVSTSNRDGRGDPAEQDDRILLVRP